MSWISSSIRRLAVVGFPPGQKQKYHQGITIRPGNSVLDAMRCNAQTQSSWLLLASRSLERFCAPDSSYATNFDS